MPDGAGIGDLRQLSGAASARQRYAIVVPGASGVRARVSSIPSSSPTRPAFGAAGGREPPGTLYVASRQDLCRRFAHDRRHRQQTSQKVKHQNQ